MHKSGFLAGFGKRLAAARQAAGVTQADVGKAVGVDRQTVYVWEAGRQAPNAWYVRQLCELLSTSADALLGLRSR